MSAISSNSIKVVSVNISEQKGTIKKPVSCIQLYNRGVQQDAHAGDWHRQVSLLGKESILNFEKEIGREIAYGEFAENITTEGITLYDTTPLDRFIIGEAELEVTQIGKKCHADACAIYREVGKCVMPKEGIFSRVIKEGEIKAGDKIQYIPKTYHVAIITLSDRASQGVYTDRSGPRTLEILQKFFNERKITVKFEHTIIPDVPDQLESLIVDAVNKKYDFIFTTGGTGIGKRDFTPDVVGSLLDKEIPGLMEMIRMKYGQKKPNAYLSRSIAGVTGDSIIYTMPGSVKAVNEYMDEIQKTMLHLVYMLHGIDAH